MTEGAPRPTPAARGYIGTVEAADLLGVRCREVYFLIDAGRLQGFRNRKGRIVLDRAEVEAFGQPDGAR